MQQTLSAHTAPSAMSRILRALLISAAATSVAAVVLQKLQPAALPHEPQPKRPPADPDALTPEEEQMLMDELAAQV